MTKAISKSRPNFSIAVTDAAGVAERWYAQYKDHFAQWPEKAEIHRKLVALGPNPDPAQVDAAIGNQSWTRAFCESCSTYADKAVTFGESYESQTVCERCLKAAVRELRAT